MGVSISNNIGQPQNSLNESQKGVNKALNRLATGLRINQAKDDPAGLAISASLESSIKSLSQAERNANDALSFFQTADGGLQEAETLLLRARELSIQSANGTYTAQDRQALQSEINQIQQQLSDIGETSFNGVEVFQDKSMTFQVGTQANETLDVTLTDPLTPLNIDVTTQSGAQTAIQTIDTALETITSARAEYGAVQSRMESTISTLGIAKGNQQESLSRIRDADIAQETANFVKNQILQKAGIAVLAQANATKQATITLFSS